MIGPGVRIGSDCAIGANCTITHAHVGDRVIIHAGCDIGQDGFGYVMDAAGHVKVPQVGRVVIGNDVEIGSGTRIDRGGIRDTVIGEGTKIDNLCQIGHNCVVGRPGSASSQSELSGSVIVLEDFVVLGPPTGIMPHIMTAKARSRRRAPRCTTTSSAGASRAAFQPGPADDRRWFSRGCGMQRLADGDAKLSKETSSKT